MRTFSYDSLSRLTQSNNPESGQINYSYDADGTLVSKTDARNVTTTYSYDTLHRLTSKTYSDGTPSVTNTYDQGCCGVTPTNVIGRLAASFSGNTELVFSYDAMGRITTQWDCPPSDTACSFFYVTGAAYNQMGALVTLNYPSGRQVKTAYNAAGRLLNVQLSLAGGAQYPYYAAAQGTPANPSTWGYWPTGAMRLGNFGNGVRELTGYNDRLQISLISESLGATTLFSKSYNLYDAAGHNNGNVMGITDLLNSAKNQIYTYDALNRISTGLQTDNAFDITFNIDPWGNMKESGTSNFTPLFDAKNRMQGWSYDAAGNLLNDGLHNYAFDAEDRIKTVDTTGAAYTYNALGNRVRKDTASSGSTEYFDFGGNTIAELNPSSGAWTDYIFGGDKRYAKDTSANASAVQYYHGDHLGTTRLMTDASGTVISNCTYAPFGEEISCSPTNASNHYKFTGKERDSETGLDNFGARYDSSSLGRFMTADPVVITTERLKNPQQLNLYAYVANNPLRFIDPTGEFLVATGDQKADYDDLCKIAGDACNRLKVDEKTGNVTFDTAGLDLTKNEGAALVNDLVTSKNTYELSSGPTVMTDKGPVAIGKTDYIVNLPTFANQLKGGNPRHGVSDVVGLYFNNPNLTRGSNTKLKVAPEFTVAFHELAEAYEKIDGGKSESYEAGHNAALQREQKLRDQRPYLKGYNTGAGGPANSPNPEGKIIIKQ